MTDPKRSEEIARALGLEFYPGHDALMVPDLWERGAEKVCDHVDLDRWLASAEGEKAVRDRVKELWNGQYQHITTEWYWENSERVFVVKLHGPKTQKRGYETFKADTKAEAYQVALLWLVKEGK